MELAEEKKKLIEGYKLEAEEINRDKIDKTKTWITENNETVAGHQKAINQFQLKNENHNQSLVTYDERGDYQNQLLTSRSFQLVHYCFDIELLWEL